MYEKLRTNSTIENMRLIYEMIRVSHWGPELNSPCDIRPKTVHVNRLIPSVYSRSNGLSDCRRPYLELCAAGCDLCAITDYV